MRLILDNTKVPTEIENVNKQQVIESIQKIDGLSISFCTLEKDNGDYIQCAGNLEKLTVEQRELNNKSFKHYRLGKPIKRLKLVKTWATIECKVGPIRVHDTEVLTKADVINLFLGYLNSRDSQMDFNRRNITRELNQNH